MILLILCSFLLVASAAPRPSFDDYGFGHSLELDDHDHFYSPSLLAAPIIKALPSAPILTHYYTEPIYAHAPPPVYKAVVHPATSYATVTSYHITHTPIVKTLLASTPVLKTYGYH